MSIRVFGGEPDALGGAVFEPSRYSVGLACPTGIFARVARWYAWRGPPFDPFRHPSTSAEFSVDAARNEKKPMRIRSARESDLPRINEIVEAAVMSWSLPERVKRLSLPVYRYDDSDLAHQRVMVVEGSDSRVVGVAALEPADSSETPGNVRALLLHGIYVDPAVHRGGYGRALLSAAIRAAHGGIYRGLLVKATRDAVGFFSGQGLERIRDPRLVNHYPYLFWSPRPKAGTPGDET